MKRRSFTTKATTFPAGNYVVSFKAAQRGNYASTQTIRVLLDGAEVGRITPTGTSYATYSTPAFAVTAGTHTLTFAGLGAAGENTAFIDDVRIAEAGGAAPTVATPAAATSNPVTGATTALSVRGADDSGETNLTYTWTVVSKPAGAADPTFSVNASYAARDTVATFNRTGSYTLRATITDLAGLSTTSNVTVTVQSTLTTVAVTPAVVTVANGLTQQLSASALDQFGQALASQPSIVWTIDSGGIGSVSATGLYTAPASGSGAVVVRATSGAASGSAAVTVTPVSVSDRGFETPEVGNGYWASYQYRPTGSPWTFTGDSGISGNMSGFTVDNPLAPQGDQVAFLQYANSRISQTVSMAAGSYTISFKAAQRGGAANQTTQTFRILIDGTEVGRFTPVGSSFASYSTGAFAVTAGSHTLTLEGLNPNGGENTALIDDLSIAPVATNTAPTVVTPAAGPPTNGKTTTLSVLGADDAGEAALRYTWAVTNKPAGAANPTFSVNGTNAAKNTTATFNRAGAYTFVVTIRDAAGLTTTSTVDVTVNATVTSIVVAPDPSAVYVGGSQQYTATVRDQFVQTISSPPAVAWSVSGGGAMSVSGLFTGATVGSHTVSAAIGGLTDTAAVTVVAHPNVRISASDASGAEPGDIGRFTVTRSANAAVPLTVYYTLTGTATNGSDYQSLTGSVTIAANATTASITITPIDDALAEGRETVIATVVAGPMYTLGSPTTATVTLHDDEKPLLSVSAADATAAEPADAGTFRITRTPGGAAPLTVYYVITGTAANGGDYQAITGSATIAAGAAFVDIAVNPVDDALSEGRETVVLTLSANAGYEINTAAATVTLHDDEKPSVSVSKPDATAAEPGTDTGVFRITRTPTTGGALTVTYTMSGTAVNGVDYATLSGSATIAAGEAFVDIVLQPLGDSLTEGGETVKLTLTNSAAYQINTSNQTITLTDGPAVAGMLSSIGSLGLGSSYVTQSPEPQGDSPVLAAPNPVRQTPYGLFVSALLSSNETTRQFQSILPGAAQEQRFTNLGAAWLPSRVSQKIERYETPARLPFAVSDDKSDGPAADAPVWLVEDDQGVYWEMFEGASSEGNTPTERATANLGTQEDE